MRADLPSSGFISESHCEFWMLLWQEQGVTFLKSAELHPLMPNKNLAHIFVLIIVMSELLLCTY